MGGAGNRSVLVAGSAFAAALFGASVATAQEAVLPEGARAVSPDGQMSVGDIDFNDPQTAFRRSSVSLRNDSVARFAPQTAAGHVPAGPRRVEVSFAASDGDLDVAFAQRASISDAGDDIDRQGRGSEVRIGRNLVEERDGRRQGPSTYVFVSSDNEALTWQPGQRSDFGGRGSSFVLQDAVEIGDMSIGVTYETHGVQASLAYVEREQSVTLGHQGFSQDENFAGVTLTMRR